MSARADKQEREILKHGDKQLWCAVINQALEDAVSPIGITERFERRRRERSRAEAREWFLNGDRDFQNVCALAGLEPERVQEYARRLIARADDGIVTTAKRTVVVNGRRLKVLQFVKSPEAIALMQETGATQSRIRIVSRKFSTFEEIAAEVRKNPDNKIRFRHPDGRSHTIKEWAEISGISNRALTYRLNVAGWTIDRAISISVEDAKKEAYAKRAKASAARYRSSGRKPKLYDYNGARRSLSALGAISGIDLKTLRWRVSHGWNINEAMTTAPQVNRWNKSSPVSAPYQRLDDHLIQSFFESLRLTA